MTLRRPFPGIPWKPLEIPGNAWNSPEMRGVSGNAWKLSETTGFEFGNCIFSQIKKNDFGGNSRKRFTGYHDRDFN